MNDDDRSTPLGLFNYARSYWQSGVLLHHARAKVTHPDAPVTLLLAHAIELYLKAFLRLRGVGIEEVRTTFGHDFKSLVDEASSRGLSLGKQEIDIAAILTEKESIRQSRSIETGYYRRPGLACSVPHPPRSRPICFSRVEGCRHAHSVDRTQPHRG